MAASIMSKKMAEGLSGLVLDVKFGNGAFLKEEALAVDLANTMIEIARGLGKTCVALITDMNQPLGRAVGNSLEVIEALDTLRGNGPNDLNTLCRELSAEMLVMGGAADDLDKARERYDERISSGAAVEKMRQIVMQQNGDAAAIDNYDLLPRARHEKAIKAATSGFIQSIDTEAIGRGSMLLGAGRMRIEDEIDPGVGLVIERKVGDRVEQGDTLVTLHFNDATLVQEAAETIERALVIGPTHVDPPPLIKTVLR
jgi:thymidine phosphorylase